MALKPIFCSVAPPTPNRFNLTVLLFPLPSGELPEYISVPDSKDLGFAGRTILALRLRVVLATGLLCRVARLPHQKTPSRRPRKFTY
jgi:hypothetical protein